ncbi:MAG: HIT family protein [Chloroflexota bacterium]|nr:HIT family protein [Chloroflexota bacterium]
MKLILCFDCDSFHIDARDLVGSWAYWHVVVNHNQNYLGKVMLVLRRHATDVAALTPNEQARLWSLLGEVKIALLGAFQPDHFNYAFLMNQDTHVHLHIIPRYAQPRVFAGMTFDDGRLGEHYDLGSRIVPLELRELVALEMRSQGLDATRLREQGIGDGGVTA